MRNLTCKAEIADDIKDKIEFVAGGDPSHITPKDIYEGTAHSVREKLFDEFNTTNKFFECASMSLVCDRPVLCTAHCSQG